MKNDTANLKTIRVIHQNHRFAVSEVDWLGERVFCKQSQPGVTGKDEISHPGSARGSDDLISPQML